MAATSRSAPRARRQPSMPYASSRLTMSASATTGIAPSTGTSARGAGTTHGSMATVAMPTVRSPAQRHRAPAASARASVGSPPATGWSRDRDRRRNTWARPHRRMSPGIIGHQCVVDRPDRVAQQHQQRHAAAERVGEHCFRPSGMRPAIATPSTTLGRTRSSRNPSQLDGDTAVDSWSQTGRMT